MQAQAHNLCGNCGKPLSEGARICPHCGASVAPPLPVLGGKAREDFVEPSLLWTGTRQGDVTAGICLGALSVPAMFALCWWIGTLLTYPGGELVILIGFPLLIIGAPIGAALLLKKRHFVAGEAMQKTLWGWLILFGLVLLGLLTVCLLNL